MQTTQHKNTRCRVYLHPTACTSPSAVERIQLRTGLLVIINLGYHALAQRPTHGESKDLSTWGGDAA